MLNFFKFLTPAPDLGVTHIVCKNKSVFGIGGEEKEKSYNDNGAPVADLSPCRPGLYRIELDALPQNELFELYSVRSGRTVLKGRVGTTARSKKGRDRLRPFSGKLFHNKDEIEAWLADPNNYVETCELITCVPAHRTSVRIFCDLCKEFVKVPAPEKVIVGGGEVDDPSPGEIKASDVNLYEAARDHFTTSHMYGGCCSEQYRSILSMETLQVIESYNSAIGEQSQQKMALADLFVHFVREVARKPSLLFAIDSEHPTTLAQAKLLLEFLNYAGFSENGQRSMRLFFCSHELILAENGGGGGPMCQLYQREAAFIRFLQKSHLAFSLSSPCFHAPTITCPCQMEEGCTPSQLDTLDKKIDMVGLSARAFSDLCAAYSMHDGICITAGPECLPEIEDFLLINYFNGRRDMFPEAVWAGGMFTKYNDKLVDVDWSKHRGEQVGPILHDSTCMWPDDWPRQIRAAQDLDLFVANVDLDSYDLFIEEFKIPQSDYSDDSCSYKLPTYINGVCFMVNIIVVKHDRVLQRIMEFDLPQCMIARQFSCRDIFWVAQSFFKNPSSLFINNSLLVEFYKKARDEPGNILLNEFYGGRLDNTSAKWNCFARFSERLQKYMFKGFARANGICAEPAQYTKN